VRSSPTYVSGIPYEEPIATEQLREITSAQISSVAKRLSGFAFAGAGMPQPAGEKDRLRPVATDVEYLLSAEGAISR
jgi:hypothetical protein